MVGFLLPFSNGSGDGVGTTSDDGPRRFILLYLDVSGMELIGSTSVGFCFLGIAR